MPTRRPPEPRRRFPRTGPLAALTGAALLAGCASLGVGGQRPSSPIAPARPAEVLPTDPLSADLAAYYQHIEAERVSRNLMRTDNGTGEAAISAAPPAQ